MNLGQLLPLPVIALQIGGQAALAAGGEASVVINLPAPYTVPSKNSSINTTGVALATVWAGSSEANVEYVAEVINPGDGATSVTVKVRNVGSAAGATAYGVAVLLIGFGQALGWGA